jgi:thioredoxin reductase (NADPH)
MASRHAKVIIIGSGPAGYTAGIYTARALLKPVLIEGIQPGGQMTITTDVENYPGFADVIQGPWLMEQMRKQADYVGTELIADQILEADLKRRPFWLKGDSGTEYTADTLIIATGAKARWLGLPSEDRFKGYGVSACATCDGFFFKGLEVVVVGGGDTAVEEATFLTKFATKVSIVHRRDELRASKIMQEKARRNPKISFVWDSVVEEVLGKTENGKKSVTGVRLKNVKSGLHTTLKTDGVFMGIGHKPNTDLFGGILDMHPNGYLAIQQGSTRTNIPGVFAAGDVADSVYRQAVTAAGSGCMAAIDAERWLESQLD